jgi:hypothetical protein
VFEGARWYRDKMVVAELSLEEIRAVWTSSEVPTQHFAATGGRCGQRTASDKSHVG